MSLLTRLFGKPEKEIKEITTESGPRKLPPESEPAGTTLRPSADATRITKKKPDPELTALELAEQQDWEIKTLPVWQPDDVILDTYEVENVISGGMGHVYIANHKNWNVKLAIKSPNEMMLSDRSNFARILREANSWTELGLHPNIAYCYYVRNIEDVPHIFVEYVDGGNLRQWIEDGMCIDYRTSLDLVIQFCHGMEHAHSKGMIHRDIKPENVLMASDGTLKITDFGLVRTESSNLTKDNIDPVDPNLTGLGTFMGTRGYMAPEQAEKAHDVDERADIFSFGVCLYEMFCGNKPYEVTFGSKQEPPDPVKLSGDKDFPSDIATILKKAVQWEPENRYSSFKEIRQELSEAYKLLFDAVSFYAELKLLDLAADGHNNRGVTYFELGREDDAVSCWEKALEIDQLHQDSTYNLSLIQWRKGKIDDLQALSRLDNCGNNPSVSKERLSELKAYIHAERYAPDAARDLLKIYPGKFDDCFPVKDIFQIRCLQILEGHTGFVSSVSLSPDGRFSISGSYDKSVRLWDLETGQCLRTVEGLPAYVNSVSFTPDGQYAVSGNNDNTLRLWDLKSGELLRTMEGHTANVHSVALTPDGKYSVSGSEDKTFRLWDLATGQCMRIMEGHTRDVHSVSLTPDCQYAVTGSADNSIKLWNLKTGICLSTMEGHTMPVNSVSFTPDGKYAASGSNDRTVRLWDIRTGQCITTMEGHTGIITSVSLSADGRCAVSGSEDETIRIWNPETGRCIRTMEEKNGHTLSVSLTSDGRYAIWATHMEPLQFWEILPLKSYQSDFVLSIIKGFGDRRKEEDALNQAINRAEALYEEGDFSKSFSILYDAWEKTGYSQNKKIHRLYSQLISKGRIKGLAFSFQRKLLQGHTQGTLTVTVTPDGRYAVSTNYDQTVRLWDIETGHCIRSLDGQDHFQSAVALTHDGRYAVSGSRDYAVRLWDLESEQCVRKMEGHTYSISAIFLTPDDRFVITGSGDKTLRVWEVETGRCIHTLKGHTNFIDAVALTADSRYAVSGSRDYSIRLWELETGDCLRTMEGHTYSICTLAVTHDGRYAISGSEDKTLRLWELETGRCLRIMEGHSDSVYSVFLTPDGRFAVSSSRDMTLRVWELETGQCQYSRSLEGHTSYVNAVALTSDARCAVSGGGDRILRVWELIWDLEFD